jgi:hypothetical protein
MYLKTKKLLSVFPLFMTDMLSFLRTRLPTISCSGIIFNSIHNYLEIMFPIDVLRFSEFRTMRNHLSETLMLNDIQITSDYMSRWVVLPLNYLKDLRDFGLDKGGVDPFSPKYIIV